MPWQWLWKTRNAIFAAALLAFCCGIVFAQGPQAATPSIFTPASTPATEINNLSYFVLEITGGIFLVVGGLLVYVIIRYRARDTDDNREPAQIYGSNQVELAWTVIPVLIVVVLFLTTARMIFAIQDAPKPKAALDVTTVAHQFWWEYRYPALGVVAANELHVPLSNTQDPKPTYMKLLSADVDHSYWVPQLSGKVDLIPNHPNELWIDPMRAGLYVGQCAQFCGAQHAKMLLRVYVDTPDQFAAWVKNQQQDGVQDPSVAAGRRVFETQACMNCHAVRGTAATGRFGPDLTHLMSRDTLASGILHNNKENLRQWIKNPDSFKPGSLMPAMQLSDDQLDQLTAYLSTLK
ncbi:cytochrome c oxidase subunit 2 [Silvibacterium bohemicum]|uniref:Cytochrome c oxidase subunit 2 n=1 Tax=Silvibacterium bohemicum TaxID=1577686 RepID=A0A841JY84_9BACT|nr:cytochrome c oxidase subunit II [Silvibacterium bohemicum]MBB6146312.1 cytochrome c oxidase subunit 2 [Silvibacterium bohemicum]